MPQDDRNTLETLKAELNFVKKGGYGGSARQPWRAHLVFEDSPTCMNYESRPNPAACTKCALMEFVPPEKRGEKVPCRHIPVTAAGETLLDLYWGATDQVIEEAVTAWLQREIAEIENARRTA
jgi:hypothetical protein